MRFVPLSLLLIVLASFPDARAQDANALFTAIEKEDVSAVTAALDAGSDVNSVNDTGASALFAAVQKQSYEISRTLVSRGAAVDYVNEQNIGATPLMMAVAYDRLPIVNMLIENGADVNLIDANGDPAINWAAYYGYTSQAERLLRAGARVDRVGHGNPREIAMRRGHQPFVDLMARAADIKLPSPDVALLVDAIKAESLEGIEDALAVGASANAVDFSGRPVLALAARTGNINIVNLLIGSGADVDAVDEIGFSALMEAARDGKIEVAKQLIAKGADVNRRAKENALFLTPMHMAALSGNADMVQLLADAGAALDPLGRDKGTPLTWGLGEGKMETTYRLLGLGADPRIKNKYGFSAADYAQQMKNADLLEAMGMESP